MRKRGTVLVHCTSPHRDLSTSIVSSHTSYALDNIFVNSLKPLGQLKLFMWHHHGIGVKMESLFKWLRSFVVSHYCQPPGAGAFCSDFTTNLTPQCRAFTRALKFEKLKALLFPGPRGGDTNDWRITEPLKVRSK